MTHNSFFYDNCTFVLVLHIENTIFLIFNFIQIPTIFIKMFTHIII